MTPRGIRNNNPGNIRWGSSWNGLDIKGKEKDKDFCVFIDPKYGIRAIAKIIITYNDKYKLSTVSKIINRWAPSNENNTSSYIKHVAEKMNVNKDQVLNVFEKNVMKSLVEAIILHENGIQPYSDDVINSGLLLAGIK